MTIVNWAVANWAKPRLQFRKPGNSFLSGDVCPSKRCCFVPCTPQSIGEIDRIFSLLVLLPLFLYEFGSRIIRVVRNGIEFLLETRLGSRVVSISIMVRVHLITYEGAIRDELGGVVEALRF
jgi:hypothetical protein